jgi:alpha-amylase
MISSELAGNLNRLNANESDVDSKSFTTLLNNLNKDEPLVNIYLDYRLLGGVGIGRKEKFIQKLVSQINRNPEMEFARPSEIMERYGPVAEIHASEPTCWLNNFHSYYYPGNELQAEAIKQLYMLNGLIENVEDINLQKDWQYLQTTDHIHLMDDQHPIYYGDGSNSIYKTRYDAFINFMNILDDFRLKIHKELKKKDKKRSVQANKKNTKATPATQSPNNLRSRK